jgi:hypothetical protein
VRHVSGWESKLLGWRPELPERESTGQFSEYSAPLFSRLLSEFLSRQLSGQSKEESAELPFQQLTD